MLKSIRSSLLPMWHVFGLCEEQLAPILLSEGVHGLFGSLVEEVMRFKRDTAQGVVTAELQAVLIYPGTVVDKGSMELSYAPSSTSRLHDSKVLCTTGLGLHRRTQTSKGVEVVNLVRAKIIPSSFI